MTTPRSSWRCLPAAWCSVGLLVAGVAAAQDVHTVRPGDTLWGISGSRYQQPSRWPELQQRNGIGDPRLLQPGTKIYFVDGRPIANDEALVLAVTGDVLRKRSGVSDLPLAPGAAVKAGDTLVTANASFLTLGLPDGSRAVIPSSSAVEVQVVDGHRTGFKLLEGRIESQVHKQRAGQQFEIRARSLVLGVRGTRFRVRAEGDRVASEVLEGRVAIRQGRAAELILDAQHGSVVTDEASAAFLEPTPQRLLPAPGFVARAPLTAQSPVVDLTPVAGATDYRWQLARDDSFLAPIAEGVSQGTSLSLPSQLDAGFYYLRVAAVDALKLEGLPGDDMVYLPAAVAALRWLPDGRVEVRWTGTSSQRFRLELARDPDFRTVVVDQPDLQTNRAVLGPFEVGGRYYWRVSEAQAGGGYGAPSAATPLDVPQR